MRIPFEHARGLRRGGGGHNAQQQHGKNNREAEHCSLESRDTRPGGDPRAAVTSECFFATEFRFSLFWPRPKLRHRDGQIRPRIAELVNRPSIYRQNGGTLPDLAEILDADWPMPSVKKTEQKISKSKKFVDTTSRYLPLWRRTRTEQRRNEVHL